MRPCDGARIRDDRGQGSTRVLQWNRGDDGMFEFWCWYDDWKPDKDYNQAMMMRDECKKIGKIRDYVSALLALAPCSSSRMEDAIAPSLLADASHIATAALQVLEAIRNE